MSLKLVAADKYSIEELTEFYNNTRVDYMVPMPMNAARLQEYVNVYDIDLHQSLVALHEDAVVGLSMLGVREDRTWITRLGVIPTIRRVGAGRALMEGMIENTQKLGVPKIQLEVITGNEPAINLFKSLGFEEQRNLLILRHAPEKVIPPKFAIRWLDGEQCLAKLDSRQGAQAWTNETESVHKVKGISAFEVSDPDIGSGWLLYQLTFFNLSRLMFETEGDDLALMHELLRHLHSNYPELDTHTENIPLDEPRLEAFWAIGYVETFRRIEMYNHL